MNLQRICACAGFSVALSASAAMADFPDDRPLTIVVPFGAGGSTDAVARFLAPELEQRLGQSVVVRNETGAGGTIGSASVAASDADGYTLGYIPVGPLATQPHLRRLPYGPEDFDYVCRLSNSPNVLFAQAGGDYSSVDDVVSAARQAPGELVYVAVPGGMPHLSMIGLNELYGIEMKRITGDTSAAAKHISGGVAQFHSGPASTLKQFDLAPLAVFGDQRIPTLPEVPTLAELGHPLEFSTWFGLVVAKGTPEPILSTLEEACREASESESFHQHLVQLDTPIDFLGSQDYAQFVIDQYESLGELLSDAGLVR